MRSVMTKSKLLSRMPPRNRVLLSPSVPASMCPSLSPRKSASMSPRRSAPGPEPTQGRSRSQLSRNGATFHQRNPAWLKSKKNIRLQIQYFRDLNDNDNAIIENKKIKCSTARIIRKLPIFESTINMYVLIKED